MKENKNKSLPKNKKGGPLNWLRRMFLGASKDLVDNTLKNTSEEQDKAAAKAQDVEEIVSPARQIVRNFCERKLAVTALIILVAMFATVFIGPMLMPTYTDEYKDTTQINIEPNYTMLSVPSELKNDVKTISSFGGNFSVGLSNAGKVYVWGATKLGTTGIDIADIPQEVLDAKIVHVAAGIDHIIAIDETGKIYGWGAHTLGQYLRTDRIVEDPMLIAIPEEFVTGTIDVENIEKLVCGYQCTAILMKNGHVYVWGNKRAYANVETFMNSTMESPMGLKDIDFTLNYIVGLDNSGSVVLGVRGLYDKVRPDVTSKAVKRSDYLKGRSIVNISTTGSTVCYMLSDNTVCFAGDFPSEAVEFPTLGAGEYFVDVQGGVKHYTGITNQGNVYSWGGNILGQCKVPSSAKANEGDKLYVGGFQSYIVDENDDIQSKWGLRGYLFGTDGNGADIMQRVVNGGRRTMTIGAVAVIISTIIGILVGCASGYFGGKVDMILMRVTEIFAAIPFLPFALILSAIMGRLPVSEAQRIFIIMCILGVLTWTGLARLVRGQVLVARENEYVTAAKAMGVKESKIAFKHILPNVISVILVTLTLDFAGCMLTESSLSYLGFGVAAPRPTWGNMLNGANNETIISNYWWQWLFPALFLAITTICINIIGDTLRDVMDPKSNSER